MNDYLKHHGILGMKWGVRRFQNKDGTLTAAGKKRYRNKDGTLTEAGKKKRTKKKLKNKLLNEVLNYGLKVIIMPQGV